MNDPEIFKKYTESDFYEKYQGSYASDKIMKKVFGCEAGRCHSAGVKSYSDAYRYDIEVMGDLLHLFKEPCGVTDEGLMWDMIHAFYIDPDGFALRMIGGVKCSADGLLSIRRMHGKYGLSEEMIREYERYRHVPVFFFPQESDGINSLRATTFGDRIDHTLFDLKRAFSGQENCMLSRAYKLPETAKWLSAVGSFEELVWIYGIRGIFVDENYNVFDLEKGGTSIISQYNESYDWSWSDAYYENLKEKIDRFTAICGEGLE